MTRTLVTGATGTLGTALRPRLVAAGHTVCAASRNPPDEPDNDIEWVELDLTDSRGINTSLNDIDIVIHAATAPQGDTEAIDVQGTKRLLEHSMGELAQVYRDVHSLRRPIVRVPLPGGTAASFRAGYATCPEYTVGTLTWKEWLTERHASNIERASPRP
jgi:hypothetical protein